MATDFMKVLQERNSILVKDGTFHNAPSGLARLSSNGEKVHYSDPESKVVESNDGKMFHRFRISTPSVDRSGDVVLPRGCLATLDRYKNNPQVYLNHQTRGLPIAMSSDPDTKEFSVQITDEGIFATAYFHGLTAESEKAYELIKLGYLRAASIGFNPLKGELIPKKKREEEDNKLDFQYFPGIKFEEWELLEWSVVGIPCNHEALEGFKSWMGKNATSDNVFYQSLKAMLADDAGKAVTVTVPAKPPKADKSKDTLFAKQDIFSEEEIQKALDTLNKKFSAKKEEEIVDPELEIEEKRVSLDEEPKKVPEKKVEQKAEVKDDALPIPESPRPPLGAEILLWTLRDIDCLYHKLEAQVPSVEHPKTKPYLEKLIGNLKDKMDDMKEFGNKNYPDFFPKDPEAKEVDTEAAELKAKAEAEAQAKADAEAKAQAEAEAQAQAEAEAEAKVWKHIQDKLNSVSLLVNSQNERLNKQFNIKKK